MIDKVKSPCVNICNVDTKSGLWKNKNSNLSFEKIIGGDFPSVKLLKDLNVDYKKFNDLSKNWISVQDYLNLNGKLNFLKTHNALVTNEGTPFTNSENTLGAIYIIRDPRNVITSLAHHYQISKEDALDFMLDEKRGIVSKVDNRYVGFQPLFSWILNQKSWVENRNFPVLTIRYEDLQDETFNTFKKVFDFINKLTNSKKSIDKEKAKESIKNCNFESLKKLEQNKGFNEAITEKGSNEKLIFFNLGKENNYKTLLNTNLINKMNDLFQNELVKFNYE